MILNIFLILAGTGLLTILYKSTRFQNILSVLGLCVLSSALYASYQGFHHFQGDNFSYSWLTSKFYPVNIDFASDKMLYLMIMTFLVSAVLNMLYMLIRETERYKLQIFSFATLGICCLILLNSSQNTLQLLISICFVDVLGFNLINNLAIRRRYIYYNLFADMALFMAFAMLWGDCRTNLFLKLGQCHYYGHDWASWLIMLSALIKSGLFPFQGVFVPMAELSEERQNILSFILTPLMGFFLFYKTFPIIFQNTTMMLVLNIVIGLTFAWNIAGILLIRQLTRKKIYLNMIFYALAYAVLIENNGAIPQALGLLFLLHVALNNGLNTSKKHIVVMFLMSVLLVSAFIFTSDSLSPVLTTSVYLIGVMVAISNMSRSPIFEMEKENNVYFKVFLSSVVAVGTICYIKNIPDNFYYWLGIYIALLILNPYRWLYKVYHSSTIQTASGFSGGFYLLVAQPVEFLGRILLLTIDFLIIEKSILGTLSKTNTLLMKLFNKMHQPDLINKIFFIAVGVILIIYSCYGVR